MVKKQKGYIAVSKLDKSKFILESYKGEVVDEEVKFPKDLGSKHPFGFEDAEKVYKSVGLISGIVKKITDSIVGDFQLKVKDENTQALLESFIKETNFTIILRPWITEAIYKGNGFIELDFSEKIPRLRVLNANNMYVRRNKKGKVLSYNQYVGNMKKYTPTSSKLITFTPSQIAHLKINEIPDDAYGWGILMPNERVIENIVKGEQDIHEIMSRKAGAPIHVKIGQPGESVNSEDVDDMSEKLKYLTNRTEWVTDGNIDMSVLNFSDLGKNLTETLNYDYHLLIAGMEVPEVLLGSGQLNEGIARVQLEAFQRKIQSYRENIQAVIEERILRPYLISNSLDEDIEFIWNLPGEEEKNKRVEQIKGLLTAPLSENMKRELQLELARILEFNDLIDLLEKPEKGIDEEEREINKQLKSQPLEQETMPDKEKEKPKNAEREKEENLKQPEVPRAKTKSKQEPIIKEKPISRTMDNLIQEEIKRVKSGEMDLKEYINLQELAGFNYSDYLINILRRVKAEKFTDLLAENDLDLKLGKLPEKEIKKLKFVLNDGFRKNKTIRQMEKEIKENINLKDRYTLKDNEEVLTMSKESRPNVIARTETIRLANMGLLDTYKDNKVGQVRFLAALSDRTCPECMSLNGAVYNIKEAYGLIPVHPNCRCTWVSI